MTGVAAFGGRASADLVDVTVTTTGGPGDYTLDFSVTNNLASPAQVQFFGVYLDSGNNIVGSPSPDYFTAEQINTNEFGGPDQFFNNTWNNFYNTGVASGVTQGGFEVQSDGHRAARLDPLVRDRVCTGRP